MVDQQDNAINQGFSMPWWGYVLIANALLGLITFEWAWMKAHRFRNPNEELNEHFPMFKKDDAKLWAKWKFLPGALTLLLPRLLFGILLVILIIIIAAILSIGRKPSDPLAPGCRKFLIRWSYKITIFLLTLVSFFTTCSYQYDDFSYEEYLGAPNDQTQSDKPISMIVCNHIGYFDIVSLLLSPLFPAYTPKAEIKKNPLLAPLCVVL
jgi:hypothetical protein